MRNGVVIQTSNYDWDNVFYDIATVVVVRNDIRIDALISMYAGYILTSLHFFTIRCLDGFAKF